MSYFSRFPLLGYTLDNNATYQVVSDVIKRVAVSQKTKENLVLFDDYDIRDGETPEIVSYKFYDSTDYHWVILLVNDIFDARFGWPLTDAQLFKYVQDKYGENNVGATHHYTLNQNSDIIVDPTANVITKNVTITYNFPTNVDYLFEYAANGTIDLSLTESQRAFVNFLQQPTNEPLPGTGALLRGDLDHNFRFASPGAPVSSLITSAEGLAMFKHVLNRPFHPDPDGPGPLTGENYTPALIFNYIKPAADAYENISSPYYGNITYLNNVMIFTGPGAASSYVYKSPTSGNIFYASTPTRTAFANFGVGNSVNPDFDDYITDIVQTYYVKGDLNRSSFLSGRISSGTGVTGTDQSYNDANVALSFQRGLITESSPYYNTIVDLIDDMSSNTLVSPLLSANVVYSQTTSPAYPNAYAVSNLAYEEEKNEAKRRIRVLKAEYLNAFITEFQSLINA